MSSFQSGNSKKVQSNIGFLVAVNVVLQVRRELCVHDIRCRDVEHVEFALHIGHWAVRPVEIQEGPLRREVGSGGRRALFVVVLIWLLLYLWLCFREFHDYAVYYITYRMSISVMILYCYRLFS